jgi:hypothetical protein
MFNRAGVNFEGQARIQAGPDGFRLVELRGSGSPPESTELWRLHLWTEPPAESPGRFGAELEIEAPTGEVLHGILEHGEVDLISDAAGRAEAWRLDLGFSTGGPESQTGTILLNGTIRSQGSFQVTADIDLGAMQEPWTPPNGAPLDERDQAAGASHTGRQPLSQVEAERKTEAQSIRRSVRRQG